MDGKRFDDLTKRWYATRLTRLRTLKGLAAGALAAVTGTVLAGDELEAKKNTRKQHDHKKKNTHKQHGDHKKKKHDGKHGKRRSGASSEFRNPKKKKKICFCTTSDPTTCKTIKPRKKAAKKHLRHPCVYKGACVPGRSGCPAPVTGCTTDAQCAPCHTCNLSSGTCVSTCDAAACQVCTDGQCVDKCIEPTICDGQGTCVGCTDPATCTQPEDPECAEATCIDGACGIDNFDPGTPCTDGVCNGEGTCVECIVNGDCDEDACEICNENNLCVDTCVAPEFCDRQGACVECLDNSDCDEDACEICNDTNQCVTSCSGETPVCNGTGTCICNDTSCVESCCNTTSGACVDYADQSDGICGADGTCAPCDTNACLSCDTSDGTCDFECSGATPVCDGSGTCVECVVNGDCDVANCQICDGNQCVTKCTGTTVCNGSGTCVGCLNNDGCNQAACEICSDSQCVTTCEGETPVCNGSGTCICNGTSCVESCCNTSTGACVEYPNQTDGICGASGTCAPCNTDECFSCDTSDGTCTFECTGAQVCFEADCCTPNTCQPGQCGTFPQGCGLPDLVCICSATTCCDKGAAATGTCQNLGTNTTCGVGGGNCVTCAPPAGVCDGNSTCVQCVDANTCPTAVAAGFDPECATPTCVSNTCGFSFAGSGVTCEVDNVCDGAGNCVECVDASTCTQPTDPQCAQATCIANVCGIFNFGTDISCFDGNLCTSNDVCNGAGACTSTTNVPANTPCGPAGDRCTNTCDGNGTCTETDVVCPAGTCQIAGTCDPITGICSAPTDQPSGQPGVNCPTPQQCCDGAICCEGGTSCTGGECVGNCGSNPPCADGFTCCGTGAAAACVLTSTLCGGVCGNVCTGTTRCCTATNTCIDEDVCCSDGSCEAGRTCCGNTCVTTDETCCEATQGCEPNGTCCDGLLCLPTDAGFRCVLDCPAPGGNDICEARYGRLTTTCDNSVFCGPSGEKCCRPRTSCTADGLCPNDRECCAGVVCCLSQQTCDTDDVCRVV